MRLARRGYSRVSFTYIYAFQAQDAPHLVKIGQSLRPRSRLRELEVGCPSAMTMVWLVKAHALAEEFLHVAFAADRVKGEWFNPSESLKGFIRSCKDQEADILTPHVMNETLPRFVTVTPEIESYQKIYARMFEHFPSRPGRALAWRNASA